MSLRHVAHLLQRGRDDASGSIVVMVTMWMAVGLTLLGLVVDLGYGSVRHRRAQNAADAATLGAMEQIYLGNSLDAATAAAGQMAQQNGFASSDLTLSLLAADGSPATSPSQVASAAAVISNTYPTLFLRVVGISTATVAAQSSSKYGSSLGLCALCVLSSGDTLSLDFPGNGSATVNGGTVQVNSNANTALVINSNGSLTAQAINVVGGWSPGSHGFFSPSPVAARPIPDPLATVPVPTFSSANGQSISVTGGTTTIDPGNYQTIDVSGGGTLIMNPGTYAITGTIKITGSGGNITGNGVMLYFTCGLILPAACSGPGQAGGTLGMAGNGTFNMSAPTSGTYKGLLIFYDRNNTSALNLTGNGTDTVTGTIYARQSDAKLAGNGGSLQLQSRLITDTATITGNGSITINWNQATNYVAPGIPGITQ